jgi:hypothetical protein
LEEAPTVKVSFFQIHFYPIAPGISRCREPAGKHQVEYLDFSYSLYADGVKVASFAEGRIGYREWARRSGRLEYIHAIDDRYDHDIDELMA